MKTKIKFLIAIALSLATTHSIRLSAQDLNEAKAKQASQAQQAFQKTIAALKAFNAKYSRVFRGHDVPIHYLDWAKDAKKGTPLVFLHGTYGTAHDLVRFAPKLIEAGYRPISVDWYGHGSTPLPSEPVSAADFAHDLKRLMDSLGIKRAVVGGHSRGGMLAGEFYRNYPKQVSGLILIDGGSTCMAKYFASLGEQGLHEWLGARFDAQGHSIVQTFASLEELFTTTWNRFGKPEDPAELFDVLSQSIKTKTGRWTRMRPSLLAWLGQDNRKNTFHGMLNPAKAPLFFGSTILFEPRIAFAKLKVPMLILDADGNSAEYRDPTPAQENEQLRMQHPKLITHIKMPTGHFLHREKPDEFISHLRKLRDSIK